MRFLGWWGFLDLPRQTPRLAPSPHRGAWNTNSYEAYSDRHVMQENIEQPDAPQTPRLKWGEKVTVHFISIVLDVALWSWFSLDGLAVKSLPPTSSLGQRSLTSEPTPQTTQPAATFENATRSNSFLCGQDKRSFWPFLQSLYLYYVQALWRGWVGTASLVV